jgi:hypothetical protein
VQAVAVAGTELVAAKASAISPNWASVCVPPSLAVSSTQASQIPLSSTFTTAAS